MKKLPLGINSFEKMISEGYVYVDKTKEIYELVESGTYYFLSRPRRFGKTLLIDTLKNLFEGREEIFKGLYIEDKWDWERSYPVIRIDFSGGEYTSTEKVSEFIEDIIDNYAKEFGVDIRKRSQPGLNLKNLVLELNKKYKEKVVLLIDEYDKPILDNIEKKDLAEEIRDYLSNFYGIIKGLDENIRFVMLTGVSKFSKVNLFSKLNNLTDLTIHHKASTICGYTEGELDKYFSEHLKGADRERIREWYNGYSWLGESVYNPYDILLFIDNGYKYRPYWFETGTPTFLLRLIKEKRYYIPELERIEATDSMLGSFDVYTMEVESLLWQTGYLTIKDSIGVPDGSQIYVLSYPNREVRISLNRYILSFMAEYKKVNLEIYKMLEEGNIEGLIEEIKGLFSGIPYTNFTKNEIDSYEGFYSSVLYSYFCALGVEIRGEDITNRGRIDLSVIAGDKVYIFEFKVVEGDKEGKAPLEQIENRKYYEKYRGKFKNIYLIGILFDKRERNIKDFKYKEIN